MDPWVIVYQAGGLIQDVVKSDPEEKIVELDWDEMERGDYPFRYWEEKLMELRLYVPPGQARKDARIWLRDAMEAAGHLPR